MLEKDRVAYIRKLDEMIDEANTSISLLCLSDIRCFVENMVITGCYDKIKNLSSQGICTLEKTFRGIKDPDSFLMEFQDSISQFFNNTKQYRIENPSSKWDIDFNCFLDNLNIFFSRIINTDYSETSFC